jgi:hypothetical protein
MKRSIALVAMSICLVVLTTSVRVRATAEGTPVVPVLLTNEFQLTYDGDGHSTPIIGQDAISYYVVYSQYPVVNGVAGNGQIYYQRIDHVNGAPFGAPVAVATGSSNQWLNHASGDYIVYTDSSGIGQYGNIFLYQISTQETTQLSTGGNAWAPKICGDMIAWIEVKAGGSQQAVICRLSSGVPGQPSVIAGPVPSVAQVDVGDRFIVWSQIVGNQYDLAAYDLQTGMSFSVASDPQVNERSPATEGPWITFESQNLATPTIVDNKAVNIDTGEQRTVVSSGARNARPNINGNLISYEGSTGYGLNSQIYVYRIQGGDTFRVTNTTFNERLNDLKDNLVAYVDNRNGNDGVFVSILNFHYPPVAVIADPNRTLRQVNSPVYLDGSGSTPSGLTYAWSVVSAPAGSTATFSNASIVNPTFTPDKWGNYILKLTVTDTEGFTGFATMNLSIDSIPVAAATASPQAVLSTGTTVTLDGSQSYDDDGDSLAYAWTLSKPQGSTATLLNPRSANPNFVADVCGDYNILLTVIDPAGNTGTATVKVSFDNLPPVANAGTSQAVPLGTTVSLDASGSSDPNGDPLTYNWSFVNKPSNSQAVLTDATSVNPSFTPDHSGLYVVQLTVNDGQLNCVTPATVQVQVFTSIAEAVSRITDLQNTIITIPSTALKNSTMKNTLLNKLNAVINSIEAGDYQAALDQLQNDILAKTDGCATQGTPDKNDWIKDCATQGQVYPVILQTIELVKGLQ